MTPCKDAVGYERFGGPCCFHLQGSTALPEGHDLDLHRRENLKCLYNYLSDFMKLGVNILSLEATPFLDFLISYHVYY
jgi:hypothetical protein